MKDGLSSDDARAIIRLLGEVTAAEDELMAQKQFLMEGLCTLVSADSWVWASTCKFDPDKIPLSAGFQCGGFSPAQYAKFQEALEHPDTGMINAHFTREFEQKQRHLTRLRDQIDRKGCFKETDVYHLWRDAGVEQVILSVRPGRDGSISQIGIYRRPGRPEFTTRESRIAHIVLSEVPWLHDVTVSPDLFSIVTHLAPRQRITLNLLLEGQNRRQIASHLGLSLHTIDGYVKDVFRYFNVHSRPALLARFQSGDGGDVA